MKPPRRLTYLVVCSVAFASLCCGARVFQRRIEIHRAGTTEQNLAYAQSIVTQERFSRLCRELKARFPKFSDEQLNRNLGISWNAQQFKSYVNGSVTTTVFVSVQGRYTRDFDPEPLVVAAVEILEPEVNPPTP